MPPPCRNHRDPTGPDTPTASAAASLVNPSPIRRQNARSTSRRGHGRPGDLNLGRTARSAICCRRTITHLQIKVLRRPVESALTAPVGVEHHTVEAQGRVPEQDRALQRGLDQIGVQAGAERIAEDAAGVAVTHCSEIEPALARLQIGDVGGPHHVEPALVEAALDQGRLNMVWTSDITYLKTGEGWLYLAAVRDGHSRRVLGYAFSASLHTDLVESALQRAVLFRDPPLGLDGVVFHADRGCPVHLGAARRRRR